MLCSGRVLAVSPYINRLFPYRFPHRSTRFRHVKHELDSRWRSMVADPGSSSSSSSSYSFVASIDSDPTEKKTAGFCIIEGPETKQDFVAMELQEIQDCIRSRRNKIFLHIEEVRRLRIQQRIKSAELGILKKAQENELPNFPSFISFLRKENITPISSKIVVPFVILEKNKRDLLSTGKNQVDREDQQLNFAEAEMGEVKEENERLKMLLARASKDYKSLQMHFFDILHQEKIRCTDSTVSSHQEKDELELVSLSLGITSTDVRKDETKNGNLSNGRQEDEKFDGKLSLGLNCRFDPSSISTVNRRNSSSINSFEELKEEEPTEIWPPSKLLKTLKNADDQVLQRQRPLKKARFSVRARCDTPTMNDGCQWRKYGQKIAKGNPCPRGYYRCNVSSSCPVRKQVQRCVDDMSILITTYEGKHDHPLPISATAMASTTSAAASTLQSRSSSSHDEALIGTSAIAPISTSSTPSTTLRGFNFTLSQSTSRPQQFYIPNSSISTSNLHPSSATVDLTTAPSTSRPFGRFSSSFSSVPRYSSTGLNFSSSSSSSLEPNTLQTHWNGHTGYNNHGTLAYNKNHIGHPYLNTTGRKQPFQEYLYQP